MPVRSAIATLILAACPPIKPTRKKLIRLLSRWLDTGMLWRGAHGIKYLLEPNNFIDSMLLRNGIYEAPAINFFCREIVDRKCEIFLDIGANIGVYSLAVFKTTPIRHIVAFEPDPRNRNQCAATVFLNGADQHVEIRPEALSEKSGKGVLYAQRGEGLDLSTVQSSLHPVKGITAEIPVPLLALDDDQDWRGKRIAMKIDIEGHEAAALLGMARTIRDNQIFMQIEIFERNLSEVGAILSQLGLIQLPKIDPTSHDYYFSNFDSAI